MIADVHVNMRTHVAHGAYSLSSFKCIGACLLIFASSPADLVEGIRISLIAQRAHTNLTTSAGLVFVCCFLSRAPRLNPPTSFTRPLTEPKAPIYTQVSSTCPFEGALELDIKLTRSPRAYELTAPRRPCAASAARLGSLILPS